MTTGTAPAHYPHEVLAPVYRHFAHIAVDIFNREGEVSPQFFMVTLDTSKPSNIKSMNAVDPAMVQALMTNGRTKDLVKPLLKMLLDGESPFRKMLKNRKVDLPDLVIQVNEAWMATSDVVPGGTEYSGSLKDLPGRKETIIVVVHTRYQSLMGMCPIEDTPKRHAVFRDVEKDGMTMMGRMSMNEEAPPSASQH